MPSYLLCFAGLFFGGVGLLAAVRLRRLALTLAAPSILLALVLSILVTSRMIGVPITSTITPLFIGCGVLAALGALSIKRCALSPREIVAIALSLATPILLLWPFFRWSLDHYPGSPYFDGWNYVVYAQYLLDHSSGAGHGSPLYLQFDASGMSGTRFGSAALIALLSRAITAPDAFGGMGLFLALTLATYGSGCASLGSALWGDDWRAPALSAIAGCSGLVLGLLQVNNFDTLLLLALSPALLALVVVANANDTATAACCGLVAGAMACVQAELAPLAYLPAAFVVIAKIYAVRSLRSWVRWLAIAMASLLAASAAWLPQALATTLQLIHSLGDSAAPLPGNGYFGAFHGVACWLPSTWGFYNPQELCSGPAPFAIAGSVCLTACVGFGIARSLHRRDMKPLLIGFLVLMVLSLYAIAAKHYAYAAFKLLVLAAPITALLLTHAAFAAGRKMAPIATTMLLALLAAPVVARTVAFDQLVRTKDISTFRYIAGAVADQPIKYLVRSDEAFLWGLLFLRSATFDRSIYDHPFFRAAKQSRPDHENARATLAVTDSAMDLACRGDILRSQNAVYRVWAMLNPDNDIPMITGVDSPNGTDIVDGQPAAWLGGDNVETTVQISARAPATVVFAARFTPGPSIPASLPRTLEIGGPNTRVRARLDEAALVTLPLSLKPGTTDLHLRVIEKAMIAKQPNGDTRPLVVLMTAPRICSSGWSPNLSEKPGVTVGP
jgi:hypothetical protein